MLFLFVWNILNTIFKQQCGFTLTKFSINRLYYLNQIQTDDLLCQLLSATPEGRSIQM